MSAASRPISTGKTRTCPHCKATILESLSICPGCMHHLRFDSEAARRQVAAAPALRVEGIIRHPPLEQPLEYFVIIAIRNDRGEEVTRQVVNVGALQAAEKRTFTLSVEVLPPSAPPLPAKSTSAASTGSTGSYKTPATASSAPPNPNPSAAAPKPPAQSANVGPGPGGGTPSPGSKTGSNLNPLAPNPNAAKPAGGGRPGNAPGGANPSGSNSGSTPGSPGSPANPATAPTSTSGYTLKPPNPGGPKRH